MLLAFVVTILILVTIHEYGHYQVARWCGVKVLKFSIGFGKTIYSKKIGKDQTEFAVGMLPLGGYVKMLDEREATVASAEKPRAFNQQNVYKRIAIVIAGPAANFIFAILAYSLILMSGTLAQKPIIGEIMPNSVAAKASLKSGDTIQRIGNQPISTWQQVSLVLLEASLKSKSVEIETKNGAKETHVLKLDLSEIKKEDYDTDFLAKLGMSAYLPSIPSIIGEILSGSPAQKAGLKMHDKVVSVNDKAVTTFEEFANIMRANPNKALKIEVLRVNKNLSVTVTPDSINENGVQIGRIGAGVLQANDSQDNWLTEVKYPAHIALLKSVEKTWDTSIFSLKMMGAMVAGKVSLKGVSGPVTVAQHAEKSVHFGWKPFLTFLAFVSISLAVLNLLPIPMLDGGHLLYYMVEIIKGSPVSERVMEFGQRIGLGLIGTLMVIAFYNDLTRIITG